MVRNVLMICGSVREGSVNAAVLGAAAELLPEDVAAVRYFRIDALPLFNPDLDRDPLPPAVIALRASIAAASALLFSTPEYAGAMPAVLKNLLEWTVGGAETTAKPAGWINPSTAPTGAAGTYASLAVVLAYTDARVVDAACVAVPVARSLISADGRIDDPEVRARIRAAVTALLQA